MRPAPFILASIVALATPVVAETVFDDAQSVASVMAKACVVDTLDFAAAFASGTSAFAETGLATVTSNDKVGMFGNPGGAHLIVTRKIDSMSCVLKLPAPQGDKAFFETLRNVFGQGVKATYPKALSVDSKLPSPHEEKHEWVFSPKDRHFAATLTWHVETGVQLGIGYRQKYE